MTAPSELFRRTSRQIIPGLDGLRAISVLCVIYGHLLWAPSFSFKALASILNPAGLGVRMFFVISGFLITTILVTEKRTSGTVSLRDFYFRRALRIFPAYYVFLLCVFVVASAGLVQLERSDYFYTLSYTFNLKGRQDTWWVGHTWSLAVEEQFYLLWPLLVCRMSEVSLRRMAFVCASLAPIGRVVFSGLTPEMFDRIYLALPLVADPIAIGALLALVAGRPQGKAWLNEVVRRRWMAMVPVLVLGIQSLEHRPHFFPHPLLLTGVLEPLSNLGLALIVARVALVREGLAGAILNSRALVAVGVASYSLYLWQMLFISPSAARLLTFPLNLCWVVAAATLSFVFVESPFNNLRRKIRVSPREVVLRALAVEAR